MKPVNLELVKMEINPSTINVEDKNVDIAQHIFAWDANESARDLCYAREKAFGGNVCATKTSDNRKAVLC